MENVFNILIRILCLSLFFCILISKKSQFIEKNENPVISEQLVKAWKCAKSEIKKKYLAFTFLVTTLNETDP